jgi:hypothetical protein
MGIGEIDTWKGIKSLGMVVESVVTILLFKMARLDENIGLVFLAWSAILKKNKL